DRSRSSPTAGSCPSPPPSTPVSPSPCSWSTQAAGAKGRLQWPTRSSPPSSVSRGPLLARRGSPAPRPRSTEAMPTHRRLLFTIAWVVPLSALLLSAIAVFPIYSATHSGRSADLYLKQLYLIGLGLVALLLALLVDYRRLADRAFLLYGVVVVALL